MHKFLHIKRKFNIDDPLQTENVSELIRRKAFLKKLYTEWYGLFIKQISNLPEGKFVEIGSGGGFIKQIFSEIITSDVLKLKNMDMLFRAERIPFKNESISGILMINVLHHIFACEDFFSEAQRVLRTGGIIYMIEPANTIFSRIVYKYFHHESFDTYAKEWSFPSSGPLSGANGALPWIIFSRDKDKFLSRYRSLKISHHKLHTPIRYMITGGLSYRSLVPGRCFEAVSLIEKMFTPIFPIIAMFQTIQLEKVNPN